MNIASILATKGGQVFTIRPEQTVRQALAVLGERNVGALVVVDPSGGAIGILSERDIVRHLARDEQALALPVDKLMTRDLVLAVPQDDLRSVGTTMVQRRIRHLPIVDGGKLVGIVSIGDVVKAQRDQYLGEVDTLETQLIEEGQGKVIKH
jgi:CBS domain-containing protein